MLGNNKKYRRSGFAKDPICEFMDFFIPFCAWCMLIVGLFTAFMIIRDMWW